MITHDQALDIFYKISIAYSDLSVAGTSGCKVCVGTRIIAALLVTVLAPSFSLALIAISAYPMYKYSKDNQDVTKK